jgi:hypothetical protein
MEIGCIGTITLAYPLLQRRSEAEPRPKAGRKGRRKVSMKVNEYVVGSNERLDSIYEDADGLLWIVEGPNGRIPVLADSAEEAMADYKGRDKKIYRTLPA